MADGEGFGEFALRGGSNLGAEELRDFVRFVYQLHVEKVADKLFYVKLKFPLDTMESGAYYSLSGKGDEKNDQVSENEQRQSVGFTQNS